MLATVVLVPTSGAYGLGGAPIDCGAQSQFGEGCVSDDGSAVTIGGSQTSGGGSGHAGADSAGDTGNTGDGPAYVPPVQLEFGSPTPLPSTCQTVFGNRCSDEILGGYAPPAAPAAPPPAGQPAVTISDLATFRPQSALAAMEPAGWAVVGLPTNVYAQIEQHVVPGTLLGQPAEVRFTPYAYRWDYGDGTTTRVGTRGGTWQSYGIDEFSPTATSHVYSAPGRYTISLTVEYTAEYRYASGIWTPVTGILTLRANDLQITAGSAETVLVARDCTQPPRGPGC